MEFEPFPKIPRLRRDCVVTEKIDGTNACVGITPEGEIFAGSRSRWVTPGKTSDNHGFAAWVEGNKDELLKLGPGRHYGEWWGHGIQRRYGLTDKRFSLFNRGRWADERPACCDVVPMLFAGEFSSSVVDDCVKRLRYGGSLAAPGFENPEGVVVFMLSSGHLYKVLCDNDAVPKSAEAQGVHSRRFGNSG